jgi:hypothetical protein
MTALAGLPDFGAPIGAPELSLFRAFGGGPAVLVPEGLQVATRPDGRPELEMVIVRRAITNAQPSYAGLAMAIDRWVAPERADQALAAARAADRAATLAPAVIDTGWVRLSGKSNAAALPEDLTGPVALAAGGLGSVRWSATLALQAGILLKEALLGGAFLITARATVEIWGIAPRLPFTVSFNPSQLRAAIAAAAGATAPRQIAYDDLVQLFSRPAATGGLAFDFSPAPPASQQASDFAAAMAGRVVAAFGKIVAAPPGEEAAYVEIAADADADMGDGRVTWDLAVPTPVPRPWLFELDPFEAARKVAGAAGPSGLVREIEVAPLPLGFWDIDVSATVPAARQGIYDLRVEIEAPARPPHRPVAVAVSVPLVEPDDGGRVTLQLSPGEQLAYTYKTLAVIQQNDGGKTLEGPATAGSATQLSLHMDEFPIQFVVLEADAGILALATFSGALRYQDGATAVTAPFQLASTAPRAALPLPPGVTAASITADVAPLGAGAPLRIGPLPAASQRFSLASFPQYGPQRVELKCHFGVGDDPATFELLAEGAAETPANVTAIALTPAQPTAEFTYVATSPFASGYRFRLRGGAWSPVLAPSAPLVLDARSAAAAPRSAAPVGEEAR